MNQILYERVCKYSEKPCVIGCYKGMPLKIEINEQVSNEDFDLKMSSECIKLIISSNNLNDFVNNVSYDQFIERLDKIYYRRIS